MISRDLGAMPPCKASVLTVNCFCSLTVTVKGWIRQIGSVLCNNGLPLLSNKEDSHQKALHLALICGATVFPFWGAIRLAYFSTF